MNALFKFRFAITIAVFFVFFASTLKGQNIVISEILASNHSTNYDPDFYGFSDWLELFNPSELEVDIGGYYLTDDPNNKTKYCIAENTVMQGRSVLLLWADSQNTVRKDIHTTFKLQREGGIIYLLNSSKVLIDSLVYTSQKPDMSYGISGDDKTHFLYFGTPSPREINPTTGSSTQNRISAPEFSTEGGVYNHGLSISLFSATQGAVIRYTTDGTIPTPASPVYSSPIQFNKSSVIRAVTFSTDRPHSKCVTNTYLINENISLPIVSITMDPFYFWDDSIGFYVEGKNGLTGGETGYGPSPKSNFNRNWRRPMHIEFYDENRQKGFSKDGEVKVYGGWSRGAVVKSLAIYPESPLNYRLFKEKPFVAYESFIIRNAGNEWARTKLRDAILQSLAINQVDVDLQANRPAVLFINGEFWGVYNIREKINEDYVKTNHGYDQNNLDFLESYRTVKSGDMVHYNAMMDFLNNNDMSDDLNYKSLKSQMDVYECMNYFMTGIYSGHGDWIYNSNNNLRLWRPRIDGGIWRWLLYDTDGSFSSSTARGIADAVGRSTHLAKLLENQDARNYFVSTFSTLLNNAFAPERAVHYIDSLKAMIEDVMPRHIAKWKNVNEMGEPAIWKTPGADGYIQSKDGYSGPCLDSYAQWEGKFTTVRKVANSRPAQLLNEMHSYFNLGSPAAIRFKVSDADAGVVEVNDIQILNVDAQTYFKDQVLHLSALPRFGYKFRDWKSISSVNAVVVSKNDSWKYLDDGSDLGTTWTDSNFDDSGWSSGNGELGYGDGGEATVVSYGPDAGNKYITTYFRKTFTADLSMIDASGTINLMVDDGAIVYINGQEVVRYNLPSGTVDYRTTASSAVVGDNESAYTSYSLPEGLIKNGANVIAVEIHQTSLSSSDISFDLELLVLKNTDSGTILSTQPDYDYVVDGDITLMAEFEVMSATVNLHLNELVANNRTSLFDETGEATDWIEIHNSSSETIDVAGLYLTDDLTNPKKCRISDRSPSVTKIAPNGYAVFYADGKPNLGAQHLNFKLSSSGEQLGLSEEIAHEMVYYDSLSYSAQIMDLSYGRYPDVSGDWLILEKATPEQPNEQYLRDEVSGLYINEIMAFNSNESGGEHSDWIEIYNDNDSPVDLGGLFISDNPDNLTKCRIPTIYPDSTTIPAKGFLVLKANEKAGKSIFNLNFKLNSKGEELALIQYSSGNERYIDYLWFGQQTNNASYGRLPDGSTTVKVLSSITPGRSNTETSSITKHSNLKMKVYPNPSTGVFYLNVEFADMYEADNIIVKVFNSSGLQIYSDILGRVHGSYTKMINLSGLEKGLYFMQVITDTGSSTFKIEKQ